MYFGEVLPPEHVHENHLVVEVLIEVALNHAEHSRDEVDVDQLVDFVRLQVRWKVIFFVVFVLVPAQVLETVVLEEMLGPDLGLRDGGLLLVGEQGEYLLGA